MVRPFAHNKIDLLVNKRFAGVSIDVFRWFFFKSENQETRSSLTSCGSLSVIYKSESTYNCSYSVANRYSFLSYMIHSFLRILSLVAITPILGLK